jgi:hypothetical protein
MKETGNNIWGKPGCELPEGKLCNACCILPNIELEGTYTSLAKPANSPCPHIAIQGCDLHLQRKPDACKGWHCSMANVNGKVELIAQGLSTGQVTRTDALVAAYDILKDDAKGNRLIDLLQVGVLDRSVELLRITHPRDLIERDLVET